MIRRARAVAVAAMLSGCLCVARAQESSEERLKAFAKLPDWSGLWEFDAFVGESVGQELSPEGLSKGRAYAAAMHPTFTPEWQPKIDQAKKEQDAARAADPNNPPAQAFRSGCWSPPFPATMLPGFYEWRITPEETTLINTQGAVRHIYTDGRAHPPKDELWPTWMGNSIGHWEGYTLVVDTIAMERPMIYLAAEQASFAVAPLSNELHTIEHIRMVNHNEMQIQFAVEDRLALAKPINMTIGYERVRGVDRMEETGTHCDPATDRNPIVNGRFTTIPVPATQAEPPR